MNDEKLKQKSSKSRKRNQRSELRKRLEGSTQSSWGTEEFQVQSMYEEEVVGSMIWPNI